jgi:histidine triad (HIT) family protein
VSSADYPDCVFCQIISKGAEVERILGWRPYRSFPLVPLQPVVPGHMLIIPLRHVRDALEDPELTGAVMESAAEYAASAGLFPCNIMTSVGREATQSVFHLHIHVVPRTEGDGLMLPWSEQQARKLAIT